MSKERSLDRFPEEFDKKLPLIEMPLPTNTPELGEIPLGARAVSAVTNRLNGSF